MPGISRFRKYVIAGIRLAGIAGIGACGGAIIYYYGFRNKSKKEIYASWTTNTSTTPIVKWDYDWDRMEPQNLVKPSKGGDDDNRFNSEVEKIRPKAVRHLLLIRHGQYETSGKTDKDRVLTELGRKQAVYTGERLKELKLPYTLLIRSTMARANETACIMAESLPCMPVRDCCLLEEGAPIPPEPPVGHWKPEYHFYQDGARIEAAFRRYFHRAHSSQQEDSYDILVCHANVIRYFVCRALQFPPEAWLRISLNHASITWVSIHPSGRVHLRTLGDTGHMPPKAITSS